MKKTTKRAQEELTHKRLHVRVSTKLYKEWKEFFDLHGHNMNSGIRTSVSFFRKWMSGDLALLAGDVSDDIRILREEINAFEKKAFKKSEKIKQLDYDFPEKKIPGYEDIKIRVTKKLRTYGKLSTPYLAQLLDIPGPEMLMIMKRIITEKNAMVFMNEDFEWCLKNE